MAESSDKLEGLEPGTYLLGREDGSVDEFFVKVTDCGEIVYHGNEQGRLVEHALHNPGWWWRRCDPPQFCPSASDMAKLPSVNRDS